MSFTDATNNSPVDVVSIGKLSCANSNIPAMGTFIGGYEAGYGYSGTGGVGLGSGALMNRTGDKLFEICSETESLIPMPLIKGHFSEDSSLADIRLLGKVYVPEVPVLSSVPIKGMMMVKDSNNQVVACPIPTSGGSTGGASKFIRLMDIPRTYRNFWMRDSIVKSRIFLTDSYSIGSEVYQSDGTTELSTGIDTIISLYHIYEGKVDSINALNNIIHYIHGVGITALTGTFTPSNLPNLKARYVASSGITLSGINVTEWDDNSGNGNNLYQTSGTNQPTWVATGGSNSTPVVRFSNAGTQYMQGTFTSTLSQPNTIFIVWKNNNTSSQEELISGIDAGHRNQIDINGNGSKTITPSAGTWGACTYTGQSAPYTITTTCIFNGVLSSIYENGVLKASGDLGVQGLTGLTVGALYNAFLTLYGDIEEIDIFNGTLTTAQQQMMEQYSENRYKHY
jgi:hypothetical protein